MASYTLTVNMSNLKSVELTENQFTVCMAKRVGTGKGPENYTVVFHAKDPLEITKFDWTDRYAMAVSIKDFENLGITEANKAQEIAFQKVMTRDDKNQHPITSDANIKSGSFAFHNNAKTHSSVVIYCSTLSRSFQTIHVTPKPLIAHSTTVFTPLPQVLVWVEAGIKTSTMIQGMRGDSLEIDFTGKTDITVTYTDEGTWVMDKPGATSG